MGLRAKIIVALLLILTALATAGSLGLRWEMERSFRVSERGEAVSDLRRLLLALDAQQLQIDSILGSWANWTELYEHARQPDPAFVARELGPEALQNGRFDWLVLLDPAGRIINAIEVPQAAGNQPLLARLRQEPQLPQWFRELSAARGNGCGLAHVRALLSMLCYRPMLPSNGVGAAHGTLIIGRWLDKGTLATVRAQTDLEFALHVAPESTAPAPREGEIRSTFGHGDPLITEFNDRLELRFPLATIVGRTVGELHMNWPRKAHRDAIASMARSQQALVLLIAVTGALMILVVDRLVVARLQRMRHELAQVSQAHRWDGHVSVESHDEIAQLGRFINDNLDLIRTQMLELHNLSTTDTLTGLPNRRRFDEELERALGQFERAGRPLALALIDIDCFKRYNDTYGHPAGDEALRRVGECLRQGARRPGDLPARIGGEEFAVIFTDTDLHGARECAETIRKLLMDAAIPHQTNTTGAVVTLSCGIALAHVGDTQRTLYSRADSALYHAKENGRNRVAVEAPTAAPAQ